MLQLQKLLCLMVPSDIQELLNVAATKALHNLPASGLHLDQQFLPTLVSGAGHDAAMMAHLTKAMRLGLHVLIILLFMPILSKTPKYL